eukprot:CAMPEP_0203920374 /NCGR_PEP_ID=MMETSP0359-20131031/60686_1 /ASSEMBLY_ACC=CAM_ASM_000338 /TAXON_ID=268821 /ORGANISM="Scrippsiella Hangoei, Strain SHTV-5" /LENGTH=48 /DNA_ID= /DNA_START= /DNA_END= /DNA_ORIENTATION=
MACVAQIFPPSIHLVEKRQDTRTAHKFILAALAASQATFGLLQDVADV